MGPVRAEPARIQSRANAMLAKLRRLSDDGAAYRRHGLVWIEGEHLCQALLRSGRRAQRAVYSQRAWDAPRLRALADAADDCVLLPDALFAELSTLESPAGIGFVLPVPSAPAIAPSGASLILDRLQDPGNVGSMLRSAAALGCRQVLALKGTVALWSPKVLRAGMGAHFALDLLEGLEPSALDGLALPFVATSSHDGQALHEMALPQPCAWVFGHEGQGVAPALAARCTLHARIPQPGGEESLNVAAAAAICLYEAARQRAVVQ